MHQLLPHHIQSFNPKAAYTDPGSNPVSLPGPCFHNHLPHKSFQIHPYSQGLNQDAHTVYYPSIQWIGLIPPKPYPTSRPNSACTSFLLPQSTLSISDMELIKETHMHKYNYKNINNLKEKSNYLPCKIQQFCKNVCHMRITEMKPGHRI